jgi:polysaccharide pyruvyl transferase WcaK-like protein
MRVARRFTKDELLKAFLEADVVLAGHDGTMGPGQGYLVLVARVMGKPVALFGGGENVLPKITWKTRRLLRFAVHHAILCTVRDCGSRDYLLANGVRSDKVFLFPDPAVLLQPCSADRAGEILGAEGITTSPDRPLAGLVAASNNAVPRHCFSAELTREGKHRRHVEFWIQMVLHLLDTTNAHLVFIPHCMGPEPTNDDRSTARDIVGALPRGRDRVTAVETEYTAGELKGLMGACDFVISERAHALIGAFSVGTPCLALGVVEDSRMHNIMEKMFGVPVFDINDPSADELRALVTDLWNRRRETAAHMAPDVERVRQEALLAAQLLKERIAAALEARA